MKTVKIIFFSAAMVIFWFPGLAQDDEFSYNEKYSITKPANIKVTTNNSNVNIVPHDSRFIEVYYTIKDKNKVIELDRERMEDIYGLKTSAEDNNFSLTLASKAKGNKLIRNLTNLSQHSIKLFVPIQSATTINSSSGDITIKGLEGNQNCKTEDGNIQVSEITGNLKANSSDGNIQANDIKGDIIGKSADGNIEVKNVGGKTQINSQDGNLNLSNIKGDINAKTSDGNINVQDVKGAINLDSNDGAIRFEGLVGSLNGRTSDGNINGSITRLDDNLSLMSGDGNINLTFPSDIGMDLKVKGNEIESDFKNFNGDVNEKSVDGKVNGGGIQANINARDGKVSIEFE